jgi:hypothetical protein
MSSGVRFEVSHIAFRTSIQAISTLDYIFESVTDDRLCSWLVEFCAD